MGLLLFFLYIFGENDYEKVVTIMNVFNKYAFDKIVSLESDEKIIEYLELQEWISSFKDLIENQFMKQNGKAIEKNFYFNFFKLYCNMFDFFSKYIKIDLDREKYPIFNIDILNNILIHYTPISSLNEEMLPIIEILEKYKIRIVKK